MSAAAIVVPGGGVREGGVLPEWVRQRLDRAIELHRGEYILALSAGTPHRPPPLDANGFPIFESRAAARYFIAGGIPAHLILTETQSYDTIGNAFFSRVIHAGPRGIERLTVVTSEFHMPRTRAAFEWIYGLEPRPFPYELRFDSVPNDSVPAGLLRARREKENNSLAALRELAARIHTLADCHRWLFTGHGAYSSEAPEFGRGSADASLLPSY